MSKSIVSKRITRLEQSLKVQLLNRSTRKLSLTEAGSVFYERCVRIYEDVRDAELEVTYTHTEPQGWLRIAAPFSFGYVHLAPAIAEFSKKHPKIKVDLHLSAHPVDLIEEGFDLGVEIGDLKDSNLIARKLASRPMRVCASPEYFKKHGIPKTPEDLTEHNCLIFEDQMTGPEWRFALNKKDIFVKVHGNMFSNNGRALLEAACEGLGIVFLPGFMVTRQLKRGSLKSVLDDYCPYGIDVHAVYPQNRHLATKIRYFIDFLVERFGEEGYWN